MPQQEVFQEDFTAGELDPRLKAREDFDRFFKGVETAKNVIVQPTGGLTRSPGLEYVDKIEYDTGYFSSNDKAQFKLIPFNFGLGEEYIMVLTHDGNNGQLKIYLNDSLDQTLTTPYSMSEVNEVSFTQSLDTLLLFHEEYEPRRVFRSSGSFSIGTWNVKNIPQANFDDSNSPTKKNEIQELDFDNMSDGDSFDISLEGEITQEFEWGTDNSDNAERFQEELHRLPITSNDGIEVSVKNDSSDIFEIKFKGDDGNFDWEKMGVSIFTGSGTVDVTVTQEGESGDEDAWSSQRGWPRSGTFYQQRLFLGGSRDLPQTIWASKVGEFFNFEEGSGDADDAITGATISSNQAEKIQWLVPQTSLFVGTDNAEYFIPQEPITPSNIAVKQSSQLGSKPNLIPQEVEGATLFAQSQGQTIREYVFSEQEQNFQAVNLSILASHLINNTRSLGRLKPQEEQNTHMVFMPNDDGDMAILSRLRFQDVRGFTQRTTKGDFVETSTVDYNAYFICRRNIPKQSPNPDSWETETKSPKKLQKAATATRDSRFIHVIGGEKNLNPLKKHLVYDTKNDSWSNNLADLPERRRYGRAVYKDGKIYFTGGIDKNSDKRKTVYTYDLNDNEWTVGSKQTEAHNLPRKHAYHGMEVSNDSVFVITENHTYKLAEGSKDWLGGRKEMPNPRNRFGIAEDNNNIYIVGGNNSNGDVVKTVSKYDVVNDSWDDSLSDLPNKRADMNCVSVFKETDTKIRIQSGREKTNSKNNKKDAYEYDVSSDSWSKISDGKNIAVWGAEAAVNNIFYVIGGNDNNDPNDITPTDVNQTYGGTFPVYYLEKWNEDRFFDASDRVEPSDPKKNFTSFGHLKSEEVDVHVDGFYLGKRTIDKNGDLILDDNVEDYIEVGFDLPEPKIKTLPVSFKVNRGSVAARKKRIYEIMLRLDNTKGIEVNGERVPFRNIGNNLLDQEIPLFSGDKFVEAVTGWSEDPQVTITQPEPQPMTILGLLTRVSF